jgi:ribosomal protein L11 methyltransferase
VLDPGRAFGTGLHPTTALVTELLEAHRDELCGARLLDVGTGSGVLALVALLYGAASVVAIDQDPDALDVARANAARNSLAERLLVRDTPLGRLAGPYDWIVANIEQRTLVGLASDLERCLAPNGTLILSGILEPGRAALCEAFGSGGARSLVPLLERSRRAGSDVWLAIAFRRRPSGRGSRGPSDRRAGSADG